MLCLLPEFDLDYVKTSLIHDNFLILKSAVSEIHISTPALFWLVLAWYIFFIHLLLIYLCLYIQTGFLIDIYGWWYFLMQSGNLCLLISAFRPLTFKEIIDMVGLMSTIFVTVFCYPCSFCRSCFFRLFLSSTLFPPLVILIKHFIQFHFSFSLAYHIILFKNLFYWLFFIIQIQFSFPWERPDCLEDSFWKMFIKRKKEILLSWKTLLVYFFHEE